MTRFLTLALTLTSTALAQDPVTPPAPADAEAAPAWDTTGQRPGQSTEAPAGPTWDATGQRPVEEMEAPEKPSRFQAGFSVLGTADFIGAGNGDEIIDIPSYGGVGADVHLGAMLGHWTGSGIPFSVLAGYRGNVEYKWGFEAAGIIADSFTQRHQAYIGLGVRSSELVIGGGAVFSTLMGGGVDTFTARGGSALAELRAGTRSGFTVSLGMNVDFYTNSVRYDGSKVRAINLFFGLGWKTL